MEAVVALAVGALTACGIHLILRARTYSLVLGFTLLSYAVNVLIFVSGRLGSVPPVALPGATALTDPLPQALVLTAIVIGFGMTAYLVALMLRAKKDTESDHVDGKEMS